GADVFVNRGNDVTGVLFDGGAGDDSSVMAGTGLQGTIGGSTGNDTYFFVGKLTGNVTIQEGPEPGVDSSVDTLNWSSYAGGNVTLDLASTSPRIVGPDLTVMLSSSTG